MKARPAFSLLELLAVLVIIGVLASIATRSMHEMVDRARVTRAISEIRSLDIQIAGYFVTHGRYPSTLAEAGIDIPHDPWGQPYVYLRMTQQNRGQARKDRFLVPLNTDYDLYSRGRDGASQPPITSRQGRDDVIRASNGGFIGLASDF